MIKDLITGPKSRFFSEWAARQAYIAMGTLVTTAALMDIDSCPLEGIEPNIYDEILNLTDSGYRTLAGCALEVIAATEIPMRAYAKARFRKEDVVWTF